MSRTTTASSEPTFGCSPIPQMESRARSLKSSQWDAGVIVNASAPKLRMSQVGMWTKADRLLVQLGLLRRLLHLASGREIEPVDDLDAADVIIVGYFDTRMRVLDAISRHKSHAVTIFLGSENAARFWTEPGEDDQLNGIATISFGHRLDLSGPGYLRTSWWLLSGYFSLRSDGHFDLPPSLTQPTDPDAWLRRPHFTTVLSRHMSYPRGELVRLFEGMGRGRVWSPSEGYRNMEWPECLHDRKVEFLTYFRFNVCPENSLSHGGGYNTEKVMEAHLGGAVPVYWGDAPFDSSVWNQERILWYNGTPEGDRHLNDTVAQLHEDAHFRASWFSQPILAPTAGQWLQQWAHNATSLIRNQLKQLGKLQSL